MRRKHSSFLPKQKRNQKSQVPVPLTHSQVTTASACAAELEFRSSTESHILASRRTANWIWSPDRAGVLKFRPKSESPGIHLQTHIVGSAMSLPYEQQVWDRARGHFHQVLKQCWCQGSHLENHSSAEHPTISLTLDSWAWEPSVTDDDTSMFPSAVASWAIESRSLESFSVLTLPCRLGASEKGTSKLNRIPLLFPRKIENHGPFLKAVHPILLTHMTLFLKLSALR